MASLPLRRTVARCSSMRLKSIRVDLASASVGMGDERVGLGRRGADRHRTGEAGEHGYIVELADGAIDAEPVDAGSFAQIDDLNPAPGVGIGGGEALVERQPLEALVARLGER